MNYVGILHDRAFQVTGPDEGGVWELSCDDPAVWFPLTHRRIRDELCDHMTVVVSRSSSAVLKLTDDGDWTESEGVPLMPPIHCLRPRSSSFGRTEIWIACCAVEYEGVRLKGEDLERHRPRQS